MIPLKDYIPTRRFPTVCLLIFLLNIFAFLVDRATGETVPVTVITPGGAVRTAQFVGGLTKSYALVPLMVLQNIKLFLVTIFTSMFLHGNWLHIGSNLLYLWIFGDNVEDAIGHVKFLFFYLGCGVCAAVLQTVSNPGSTVPMVGASGAIAGVMGAYLIMYPRSRIFTLVPIFIFFTFMELPALLIIGYWALLQFLNATVFGGGEMLHGGGVAYFAHIGGFIAGILYALLTPVLHTRVRNYR